MRGLRAAGWLRVVISNQPDRAKGKNTAGEQARLEARFVELLAEAGETLDGVYYCYHHPEGAGGGVDPDLRLPETGHGAGGPGGGRAGD